jgi:hypothetical protein
VDGNSCKSTSESVKSSAVNFQSSRETADSSAVSS